MLKITVHQSGTTPKEMALKIEEGSRRLEGLMIRLGRETAEYMGGVVKAETKRHPATGTLASSIQSEVIPGILFTVGVGKVLDLPPYWHVINYGVKLTDGQAFIPGGGKRVSGDFGGNSPDSQYQGVEGGAGVVMNHPGNFAVKAFKAIEGKNYIEKTASWLTGRWRGLVKKLPK